MSIEENKTLIRRFAEEVFNKGNTEVIDELIAPDYIDHSAPPDAPQGPAVAQQAYTMFRTAFPDLQVTIEDIIAEGDKVGFRAVWKGTHKGELMGIPPTGKPITILAHVMLKIRNGKFVERWEQGDMLGLMQQLGVVPLPDQGGS